MPDCCFLICLSHKTRPSGSYSKFSSGFFTWTKIVHKSVFLTTVCDLILASVGIKKWLLKVTTRRKMDARIFRFVIGLTCLSLHLVLAEDAGNVDTNEIQDSQGKRPSFTFH